LKEELVGRNSLSTPNKKIYIDGENKNIEVKNLKKFNYISGFKSIRQVFLSE